MQPPPTPTINYSVEFPTFGEISGVSRSRVHWVSLALGEPSSQSWYLPCQVSFPFFFLIKSIWNEQFFILQLLVLQFPQCVALKPSVSYAKYSNFSEYFRTPDTCLINLFCTAKSLLLKDYNPSET